jgi:hypothetical protein
MAAGGWCERTHITLRRAVNQNFRIELNGARGILTEFVGGENSIQLQRYVGGKWPAEGGERGKHLRAKSINS